MRVIIYDDELLFREARGSLLAMRGFEFVGFLGTTEDALMMVQAVPAHALSRHPPVVR
jgi:DNA-binding NarL/FixJ family response regulator